MKFRKLKQKILSQIKEEEIDEKMLPWIKKFNELKNVCTVFCCQGHTRDEISEDELKEIEENMSIDGFGVKFAGYDPYIMFILNSKKLEKDIIEIGGINSKEDFYCTILNHVSCKPFYRYSFHMPLKFDKYIEKVYNGCKKWNEQKI